MYFWPRAAPCGVLPRICQCSTKPVHKQGKYSQSGSKIPAVWSCLNADENALLATATHGDSLSPDLIGGKPMIILQDAAFGVAEVDSFRPGSSLKELWECQKHQWLLLRVSWILQTQYLELDGPLFNLLHIARLSPTTLLGLIDNNTFLLAHIPIYFNCLIEESKILQHKVSYVGSLHPLSTSRSYVHRHAKLFSAYRMYYLQGKPRALKPEFKGRGEKSCTWGASFEIHLPANSHVNQYATQRIAKGDPTKWWQKKRSKTVCTSFSDLEPATRNSSNSGTLWNTCFVIIIIIIIIIIVITIIIIIIIIISHTWWLCNWQLHLLAMIPSVLAGQGNKTGNKMQTQSFWQNCYQ